MTKAHFVEDDVIARNDLKKLEKKKKLNEYSRNWRKKNPEKSKLIKQRYEVKRKLKRLEIKKEKENNKYF